MNEDGERLACNAIPVSPDDFNPQAVLPCGCTVEHIYRAMTDFIDFLCFINQQLNSRAIERLECLLMPAHFSSIVGELIGASIPRYCPGLVKNRYHNGHPDLIPAGRFPGDAVQYCHEGIEIKGSRYMKAWQGHNAEASWLMVFMFDSSRPSDPFKGIPPRPFRFIEVLGAQLTAEDWKFAGRSETSRRTITASVTDTGYEKMASNWIYRET